MAIKIATKMVGKNSLVIILSTSSPPVPNIVSGSCPSLVKYIRARIPMVTAAASVKSVNSSATHLPLSISCSLFIDIKRTYTCGEPKKPKPIIEKPSMVNKFIQPSSLLPIICVKVGSIALSPWVIPAP